MPDDHSRVAVLYRDYAGMLRGLMRYRFGIPEAETENLLHDIFTSLLRSTTAIDNEEKWLVGAACNASRFFWRDTDGPETIRLTETIGEPAAIERSIALEQILEKLPDRAGEVLRLRYLEGLSGKEIAARYGTSVAYTNLLIHRSLRKARELAKGKQP